MVDNLLAYFNNVRMCFRFVMLGVDIYLIFPLGLSHSLDVKPSDDVLEINNGSPVRFNVVVRDQAGNMTAEQKGQVNCKV